MIYIEEHNEWKKQNILFKFPARGRKDKFLATLASYYSQAVNKDNMQFLISIDEDDVELNCDEIKEVVASYKNAQIIVGPPKGKINAVNRDMEKASDWDIVVLVSDDMVPKLKGFDMIIRKDMHTHFPDGDGVLWYNDGHQGENLNTLCILGKKYYYRFGYIYNSEYKSLCSDNEFMEVSKRLGKVQYNSLCIIEHQHWAWGYGEMDDLYIKNEEFLSDDYKTLDRRRAMGFGLNINEHA